MLGMEITAFLLDASYVMKSGKSLVRLLLKGLDGRTLRVYDDRFLPYFFVLAPFANAAEETRIRDGLSSMTAPARDGTAKVVRVEMVDRLHSGKPARLFKIVCQHPSHVPRLREEAKRFGTPYEDGIVFTKRYVLDHRLHPCNWVKVSYGDDRMVASVEPVPTPDDADMRLSVVAFDIETYNAQGMPRPESDPSLMVGVANGSGTELFTYSKPFAAPGIHVKPTEKDMLESFSLYLKAQKADVVCTYNGDVFDLPYLRERAKRTKAQMRLGRDRALPSAKQLGLRMQSSLGGRIHFDAFPVVSMLSYIGAFKVQRLTLKEVYKELLGGKKEEVEKLDIWKIWDSGSPAELEHLAHYCRVDAQAAYDLSQYVLPLETAMSRITGMTLFDTARATPGRLVESLLLRMAFESNELMPNKPSYAQVQARSEHPVEGAFVQLPSPGVYEHLAVLDYRSLYPSIIISHNIDPSTFNCDCCTPAESYVSPNGHRFCKKRKGLIPRMLKFVLDNRMALKTRMKELKKKGEDGSPLYKQLDARQWALKILANSTYGYLLYARSRYYSRECGESVTAWGRHYVQDTLKKAEAFGLRPLYADTDSAFLQFNSPENESKVFAFQKQVNAELPEDMALELEDIYPRGIFVSKKQESEKGAKKKYALINKQGKIKIRGFELVRRDWSKVAKETQRQVIQILLGEGNVEKARNVVRDMVDLLKSGKVPLEDLAIYTQLKKKAKSYEIVSPEVSAFLKAQKAGLQVDERSVIAYVITKQGKSISEKATLLEMAKDYDADYYINNQVLPAVLKILGSMGFSEDDLTMKGKQMGLGSW